MLLADMAEQSADRPDHQALSEQAESLQDARWMNLALAQARAAALAGEVPVGAVLVCDGRVIATGRNAPIASHDPTAHAEIVALRAGAQQLNNYRLTQCELFVTLEPCCMCAAAMLHARLKRVVYGAPDAKTGAAGSVINLFGMPQLNHHTQVAGGVQAHACAQLLQDFFKRQRTQQQQQQAGRALRDDALRTPARCFDALPPLSEPSNYISVLPSLAGLRLHYVDTGPVDAEQTLLCLHGPQDWCLVWRDQILQGRAQGYRVVCPDLIGFGKSDKPKKKQFHTWQRHADIVLALLHALDLKHVTLLAPDTMRTLTVMLRTGAPQRISAARYSPGIELSPTERAAPFPDVGHQAALRAFVELMTEPFFLAATASK